MTNTRITDPEILEMRYPVVLRKFSLRPGSGGNGAHRGGNGVIREMMFRWGKFSILSILFNILLIALLKLNLNYIYMHIFILIKAVLHP